uniref:Uncharacterized protein n=1 Tax=viral metagenome TaxID=1070528 RepID=A0A6C0I7S4_9ZZZZ
MSRIEDPNKVLKNSIFSLCDQYALKCVFNSETFVMLIFHFFILKTLGIKMLTYFITNVNRFFPKTP